MSQIWIDSGHGMNNYFYYNNYKTYDTYQWNSSSKWDEYPEKVIIEGVQSSTLEAVKLLTTQLDAAQRQIEALNAQLNSKSCTECPVHTKLFVPAHDPEKPVGKLASLESPFDKVMDM